MPDFHPDCIINLHLHGHGHPAKYTWSCSLITRDSVRLVLARKFLGIVSRDEAEWSVALFGLRQAERLQQEKVQLSSGFTVPLGQEPGRPKSPEVQLMRAEAERIWSSFRLKKLGRVSLDEEKVLQEEASFSRKKGSK